MTIAELRRLTGGLLLATLATLAALLTGCSGGDNSVQIRDPQPAPYVYAPPPDNGDGWRVADARSRDVDVTLLETLTNNIRQHADGFRYVDSILIARAGEMLYHQEFRNQLDFTDEWAGNRNVSLHIMNSATKSFTSTLIGIAIDRGEIPGVDVLVHGYFADKFPIANWSDDKAAITLEDWLTMRSGYQWDEHDSSYFDPANINARMNNAADPIQFLLDVPMAAAPGEVFAYSTGVSYALGRLLQRATGQSVQNYMEAYLFGPLDINEYTYWSTDGQLQTGSGLYLKTRDMAKLGQLFLDKGTWNGTRVISEHWVDEATMRRVEVPPRGYGYQWWMTSYTVAGVTYDAFYANGLGGQYIFVFPALDVVVAMTGGVYEQYQVDQRNLTGMMQDYILASLL